MPSQKTIRDNMADKLTNILVVISEKNFDNDLKMYPIIEPISGKKIIAYSI